MNLRCLCLIKMYSVREVLSEKITLSYYSLKHGIKKAAVCGGLFN